MLQMNFLCQFHVYQPTLVNFVFSLGVTLKIDILIQIFSKNQKLEKLMIVVKSSFSQLSGYLDDCSCEIPTLDQYNNVIIYPQIHRLVQYNFFRYYKANTKRKCKFWDLDWKCRFSTGGCTVESCPHEEIPDGIKGMNHYQY